MNELALQRTKGNHLKAKYFAGGSKLVVSVGEPSGPFAGPLEESIVAAKLIQKSAQAAGQEIYLCLSGGVDSECMALAFLAAGVSFTAAILRFDRNLNDFDIRYAIDFCQERDIRIKFIDVDAIDFYDRGEHLAWSAKYYCRSPMIALHLYLMSQVPGFPVFAWNLTGLGIDPISGRYRAFLPSELYFSYHRYLDAERRPGVSFFFLYSPELFYSFFHTPTYRNILLQKEVSGEFDYETKCRIYQEGGFEITPRPDKYTGFEKIKEIYTREEPQNKYMYNELLRAPLEHYFPDPDVTYSLISSRFLPARSGAEAKQKFLNQNLTSL